MKKLADLLSDYTTVSLIGTAKNVGKTTVLNHLIAFCAASPLGLTSIGRDGETIDVVTKTEKPRIFVRCGTLLATALQMLPLCDITKEILAATGMQTPLGEVVIIRALSDGYVQLGGASINSQMAALCADLQAFGAVKVLVDGALGRKTLSAPAVTEAAILCTGAALHADMAAVVSQTAHIANLLSLPAVSDAYQVAALEAAPQHEKVVGIAEANLILMRGAVSDTQLLRLIMSNQNLKGKTIVAEDASKFFITESTLEKLHIKQARLCVRRAINLLAITVNPVAPAGHMFDKTAFLAKMRKKSPVPVYDVKRGTEQSLAYS